MCYEKSKDGVIPVTFNPIGVGTKYLLTDLIKISKDELRGQYPPGSPFIGGSRKNHLTRKQHWTRSKPSRFKTHRIY